VVKVGQEVEFEGGDKERETFPEVKGRQDKNFRLICAPVIISSLKH
jgi:hypothetical protein